jgi:hypothetical protein
MAAKVRKTVADFWFLVTGYFDTSNRAPIEVLLRRNPCLPTSRLSSFLSLFCKPHPSFPSPPKAEKGVTEKQTFCSTTSAK